MLVIPSKRHTKRSVEFLNEQETAALLAAPDLSTWIGLLDGTLLLVAVQTGLRSSELRALRGPDVELDGGAYVNRAGKGHKTGCTPLRGDVVAAVPDWLTEQTPQADDSVFRSLRGDFLSADALQRIVNRHVQSAHTWWDLLREGVASYALETGGAELPAGHFTEWLAEWGRELRRRQTGLLLLSAHRAKGLELDHVAVLDGGWDRIGRDEDPDAPRRLYYVAMTRARETLTLARLGARHPFLDALAGEASCLVRPPVDLPSPPPGLARQYRRLSLAEVDLGFAGRRPAGDPVHQAVAQLSAGDPLTLGGDGGRRGLIDQHGRVVGRLARAFVPPAHMACVEARVLAIVVRRREDGDPAYREQVRCERWEVVVPQMLFEPRCEAGGSVPR